MRGQCDVVEIYLGQFVSYFCFAFHFSLLSTDILFSLCSYACSSVFEPFFHSAISFPFACPAHSFRRLGLVAVGLHVCRVLLVALEMFVLIFVLPGVISSEFLALMSIHRLSQSCSWMLTARPSRWSSFSDITNSDGLLVGEMMASSWTWFWSFPLLRPSAYTPFVQCFKNWIIKRRLVNFLFQPRIHDSVASASHITAEISQCFFMLSSPTWWDWWATSNVVSALEAERFSWLAGCWCIHLAK